MPQDMWWLIGAWQRSGVRIWHLPQWSWCAARSLCNNKEKCEGREKNLPLKKPPPPPNCLPGPGEGWIPGEHTGGRGPRTGRCCPAHTAHTAYLVRERGRSPGNTLVAEAPGLAGAAPFTPPELLPAPPSGPPQLRLLLGRENNSCL